MCKLGAGLCSKLPRILICAFLGLLSLGFADRMLRGIDKAIDSFGGRMTSYHVTRLEKAGKADSDCEAKPAVARSCEKGNTFLPYGIAMLASFAGLIVCVAGLTVALRED